MYRDFTIELVRDGKVIETAVVREYDGECLGANLFYQALDTFKVKAGDIIKTVKGSTLIRLEEDGFHYICL